VALRDGEKELRDLLRRKLDGADLVKAVTLLNRVLNDAEEQAAYVQSMTEFSGRK